MNLGEDYSLITDYDFGDYNEYYDNDAITTEEPDLNIEDFKFDGADAVASVLAIVMAFLAFFLILIVAIYVYNGIALMRIFKKANHKNPWASWVPFYNRWVLAEVSGYPGYLGLISCFASAAPIVGPIAMLVIMILIYNQLSKSFGKDGGFTVGLVLLCPIFIGILAFGGSEYIGPNGDNKATPEWANPVKK